MNLSPQVFAEILQALRSGRASAAAAERRRATRMQLEAKVQVALPRADRGFEQVTALTRDISYSGIGLVLGTQLPAGSELIIRLPRHVKPPVIVRSVVRFAAPLADGLYLAGVEFISELSAQQAEVILRSPEHEVQRIQDSILG